MAKRRDNGPKSGANSHYSDGRYYDQTYRRRREDVRFYVERAVASGGPVLELGTGTGRVALSIARAGLEIVAVDDSAFMLSRAQDKAERLPRAVRNRVEFRRGDLKRLRLKRRFALVIAPFHVWNHLYTHADITRGFRTAHHHVRPRGRFVFDVLVPDPVTLGRDPTRRYRGGLVPHPRDGEKYRYGEFFHYDTASQVETVTMDFEHPSDRSRSFCTKLTQRHFFPAELASLVEHHGFTIDSHTGDFRGERITRATETQVVVARRRTR
ncbi:MAG: class I SAM-dependent methyltransferase [Myxococcota bacterium]